MSNRETVRFYEDGLYDFKQYILPDVFDQLLIAGDLEEMQIVCAGAFSDGKPVGAAIAQLLEDNEIYLQSIMVDSEYRRQGIGRDLMNGILSDAYNEFSTDNDIPDLPMRVFIHADYILPPEDMAGVDAFLEKFGFSDFYEMENCCYIDGSTVRVPEGFSQPQNVISFASDAAGYEDELWDYLNSRRLDVNPGHAFMLVSEDKVKAVLFAENGTEDEYFVRGFANVPVSDGEFEAMLYSLVSAVKRENPDFIFVADEHEIINPEYFERFTEAHGEIYKHKEAGFYGEFSSEKE